jgi:hypothetical protein
MRCKDALRLSTAYLDGELTPARSSAVRGHLRGCAACAQVFADEGRVRDLAQGLCKESDPPAAVWQGVKKQMAALEVADSKARWPKFSWWQPVAVAGNLALVCLVYWLVQSQPTNTPAQMTKARPRPIPAQTISYEEAREQERQEVYRLFSEVREDVQASDLHWTRNHGLTRSPVDGTFVLSTELDRMAFLRNDLDRQVRALW